MMTKEEKKEKIKWIIGRFDDIYCHENPRLLPPIRELLKKGEGIILMAGISEWLESELNEIL